MSTPLSQRDAYAPSAPSALDASSSSSAPAVDAATTLVLPIDHPASIRRAAGLAAAGSAVGFFLGGLCVALGDAGNPDFAAWTTRSKGEGRVGRPLATILPAQEVVPMIDPEGIPAALRHILLDPADLVARLGAMVFIRLPIRESVARAVPPWLLSRSADGRPLFQFMDPHGYDPVRRFMEALKEEGVRFPGGSSMNVSGQPEVVVREQGIAFAREKGVPLFLADRLSPIGITGSYPILLFGPEAVSLVREGPVPGWVLERLLEHPIDTTETKAAKYPQLAIAPALLAGLTPYQVRSAVMLRLQGWSDAEIRARLGRN
jgi:hypothetical protein